LAGHQNCSPRKLHIMAATPATMAAAPAELTPVDQLVADVRQTHWFLAAHANVVGDADTTVQAAQYTSMMARLASLPQLDAASATSLTTAFGEGPWDPTQMQSLVARIGETLIAVEMRNTTINHGGRRPSQRLLQFFEYMTRTEFLAMKDKKLHMLTLLSLVVDRCWRVGLQMPDETTTRHIVAVVMLIGMPSDIDDPLVCFNVVTEFKKLIKNRARMHGLPPATWITVYPNSPHGLPAAVYDSAYDTEPPISIELPNLASYEAGVALRKSSKLLRHNPSVFGHAAPAQMQAAPAAANPQVMMMQFMQQMAAMMSGHQQGPNIKLFSPTRRGDCGSMETLGEDCALKDGTGEGADRPLGASSHDPLGVGGSSGASSSMVTPPARAALFQRPALQDQAADGMSSNAQADLMLTAMSNRSQADEEEKQEEAKAKATPKVKAKAKAKATPKVKAHAKAKAATKLVKTVVTKKPAASALTVKPKIAWDPAMTAGGKNSWTSKHYHSASKKMAATGASPDACKAAGKAAYAEAVAVWDSNN
jgi:hypothetical protein